MLLFIEQLAVPMPGRHKTRSLARLEGICLARTEGGCPTALGSVRLRPTRPGAGSGLLAATKPPETTEICQVSAIKLKSC